MYVILRNDNILLLLVNPVINQMFVACKLKLLLLMILTMFQEIDLTPAPLTASVIRRDAMTFSDFPTYVEYYTVLVRPSADLGADLHIKPFKMEVWLTIAAAVILTGVVLSLTSLVHLRNSPTLSKTDVAQEACLSMMLNEVWLAYSVMLLQSESTCW